jgi:hypothetical protein
MKTLAVILLSSLTSAVVGSLIVWIGLGLFPGSTTGFDITLYLGILCVATPVVLAAGGATAWIAFPYVKVFERPKFLSALGGVGGATMYLFINIVIASMSERGAIWSFFRSGAFVFPIIVGFVFGSCFGYALTWFRRLLLGEER